MNRNNKPSLILAPKAEATEPVLQFMISSVTHVVVCLVPSEDGDEVMHQDTDSDVAEQKEGGKGKVKWTQEEVIVGTCPSPATICFTLGQLT